MSEKHLDEPKNALLKPELGRLGYSPSEVARAMKRDPATIYRAIYRGELHVLDYGGRIMIPASEVTRFFQNIIQYSPRKKKPAAKRKSE